jgi:hypoxanthine-DNA glycosylase
MIETHLFGDFIPRNPKFLLLGSFVAKKRDNDFNYDWFYGSSRNQFWKILEQVYDLKLDSKEKKQKLFVDLRMAMSDIILQCERRDDTSADNNLINIVYHIEGVRSILSNNKIEKIFFSSRFVENEFRKYFKDIIRDFPKVELVTLPSPSPRYAQMTKDQKIERYREILPRIDINL